MTNKTKFPHRLKQDGTDDTMCLACFKTISPTSFDAATGSPRHAEEYDHVCAFAFPERRANDLTFEDGPKRRRADMDWQALISREAILPSE
jgi:hypothetical protein